MENSLSIKNKIKVFISSRCGEGYERYNEVRKELKKLIESSQIADVYLFEEEGSSTLTAQKHYLYAIDESDVCIFLIDNSDGVTPAIVKEINRAKSHPKKSLFLFCNEKEKEPTQIQKELIGANGSKYYVVKNFQDFIKHGYQDLMNDITMVYRYYCRNVLVDKELETDKNNNVKVTSIFSDSITKQNLRGIDKSKSYISNLIYPMNYEIKESTELDDYLEQFLRVLYGEKGIKEFNVGLYMSKLEEDQDKDLNQIVKLRWKAIQSYWLDDLDNVIKYLNDSLNLSKEKSMPDWFIQDILIDLRNAQSKKAELENKIALETQAQKELNSMSQVLFYPVIDRAEKHFYEEINKEYKRYKPRSIYAVNFGNNLSIYAEELVKIYVTACYYGSLTHILLLKNRMRDVAFHLCEEYDNWEFRVLLIKFSIITDNSKKIAEYITYFNNILGKMNSKDAMEIFEFTNVLPIKEERLKSKLEVIKHLGYFFSDTDYKTILDELIKEVYDWIEQEDRVVSLGDLIISTIQQNRFRIDSNTIIKLCLKILNKEMYRFYDNVFGLLETLDLSNVLDENLELLKKAIVKAVLDQEVRNGSRNLINVIINITKQVEKYREEFNQIVEKNLSESYKQLYNLETTNTNNTFFIKKYIQEIKKKINTQGKNGIYSVGAYDYYLIIKNIFDSNPDIIEFNQVNDVIEVCVESLLANNITYSEKVSAIQLIIYIKLKFNNNNISYEDVYKKLVDNIEKLIDVHEDMFQKHSQLTLKFNLLMFQMIIKKMDIVGLIDMLSEINNDEEFEQVQCLKAIINAINNEYFNELDYDVQNVLLQFVLSLKKHSNQDIRYLVIRLLLKMITPKNKKTILTQLSKFMDYDNVYIKNLIINNFDTLGEFDKDITKLMLQKASVDNHFIVRDNSKKYIERNSVQI